MSKNYKQQSNTTFYCFSPLAMIVTFALEIILAIYTIVRYKLNAVVRLVVAMLVFLAIFQLAEYMVCKGAPHDSLVWSRIGFVSITMLPPLGLHLTFVLSKASRWLSWGVLLPAYASAVLFILFFWLAKDALTGNQCLGNYVIFQIAEGRGWLYGLYYYGWILASLISGAYFIRRTQQMRQRRAMILLLISYLAFLLPTATANIVSPQTLNAIPSVMCGFAVILALMLVIVVLPSIFTKQPRK